jgi:hypothetical protein
MDDTENARRKMVREINSKLAEREALEKEHGKVWDTSEVSRDFEILGFMAPYVVVKRRNDQVEGTLMFQDRPRFYFLFETDQLPTKTKEKGGEQ